METLGALPTLYTVYATPQLKSRISLSRFETASSELQCVLHVILLLLWIPQQPALCFEENNKFTLKIILRVKKDFQQNVSPLNNL